MEHNREFLVKSERKRYIRSEYCVGVGDASTHPRVPELPRDEQRLATTPEARRRSTELLPTFLANTENALVVGSVTRTDRLLGTVTTYGDTGTDCHLLGDLYRTEVSALAGGPTVPDELTADSPRGGFEAGLDGVAGLSLDDRTLRPCIDEGCSPGATADRLGVDPTVVRRVLRWCRTTRHKRHCPPDPSMNG